MSFAFFDLDGTLLPHDTQLLFANQVLREDPWRRLLLAPFVAALPAAVPRLLRSREMKRLFLAYACGLTAGQLEAHARRFAETTVPAALFPELVEEIARHRREGRTLVLNTASPDFYARHIARVLGFDHCFATRVVVGARMPLIPEIEGPNNKRDAKIPPMAAILPPSFNPRSPEPLPDSWAYSDSHVDLPLLACAEHPVAVRPTPRLEAAARDGGWTILRPTRTVGGGLPGRLAPLAQFLGCYDPPVDWMGTGRQLAG